MSSVVANGLVAGLVWFPFVLAIGLTYRHLKLIDVSIDGVAVMAGVAAALVWQATGSYAASFAAGGVTGMLGGVLLGGLVFALGIDPLLAGVLASLALHSISVLAVGESQVLRDTVLAGSASRFVAVLAAFACALGTAATLFYRTHFGLLVRALGSNPAFHSTLPRGLVVTAGLAFSGALIGLGGGMYVHAEGVARSGGGFDFLLTGLTSFLAVERLGGLLAARVRRRPRGTGVAPRSRLSAALNGVSALAVLALLGACAFQVLVQAVLFWSPRPDLWKMMLAMLLIASLGRMRLRGVAGVLGALLARTPRSARGTRGPRLRVSGVDKVVREARPPLHLLHGVSFEAEHGVVALTGANGTGKTTLLRCLAGESEVDGGSIAVDGRAAERVPRFRRGMFHLFQEPHANLAPDLSVYENLLCAAWPTLRPFGLPSRRGAGGMLETLAAAYPSSQISFAAEDFLDRGAPELSGGEAQCVAVLMAILSQAPVVLADEPTANLDAKNRERVISLLGGAARERVVVAVTHDPALLQRALRRLRLRAGALEELGPVRPDPSITGVPDER